MKKNLFAHAVMRYAILVAFAAIWFPGVAHAVPAFARQTGQPCATCHVGAFGPQLKPYGRNFKLNGYINSDGSTGHFPPLAMETQSSFTHTNKDQPGPAASSTLFGPAGPNNNFAQDTVLFFYAGRITPEIGAFSELTYDGVANRLHWDDTDVRYSYHGDVFDTPYVAGITVNNHPSVSDLWNSTPAWGFPYDTSHLALTPSASTLIDNNLGQRVIGAGAYASFDDLVYVEFDGYYPLPRGPLSSLGILSPTGTNNYGDFMPYWRLALEHTFDDDYFEFGTYGIHGDVFPGGVHTAGSNSVTDVAFDANYQYVGDKDNFVSAHGTFIHEILDLNASRQSGSNAGDRLNTFRADVSYSYQDTIIPSVQRFSTWGTTDAAFWGTANGSPDSSGYTMEIAYVPFGKKDSFTHFYNMRLSLEYTAYTKFNGTSNHASDNNVLLLHLWLAGAPW